jgi:hypothetical protein
MLGSVFWIRICLDPQLFGFLDPDMKILPLNLGPGPNPDPNPDPTHTNVIFFKNNQVLHRDE